MENIVALLVAGVILAAAGTAFAGEPLGRYNAQPGPGTLPGGVEQVYADYSHVGQSGPAVVKDIPEGTGDNVGVGVALRNVGRALMVSANTPGSYDVELAAKQAQLKVQLAQK